MRHPSKQQALDRRTAGPALAKVQIRRQHKNQERTDALTEIVNRTLRYRVRIKIKLRLENIPSQNRLEIRG